MGQNFKTPKGEISVTNFEGRIRLRWRYAGERYSLNLPYAYLPENLYYGTIKATEIKLDILRGCFDASLEKYNGAKVWVKINVYVNGQVIKSAEEKVLGLGPTVQVNLNEVK